MKKQVMAVLLAGMLVVGSFTTAFADDSTTSSESSSETPPDLPSDSSGGPSDGGSAPGGSSSSSSVTWSGATTFTSKTTQTGKTYTSTSADENAVLVDTDAKVLLKKFTLTKSGGTSASDDYSFYGINSGILAKGGATLIIRNATIKTSAAGANGVFSYGANSGTTNAEGDGTTVRISNSTIRTTGDGSGGIMTTYGGTTIAANLTVSTKGGSSAPIRTDRGGGWVTVKGGKYVSSGLGSPAIYSTADVKVSKATLVSKQSEGVCIEGTGSIALTNCKLTANNTKTNGNATFYDTIMIYQSMSGDASDGTSSFTMKGGTLTSKSGHTIHVTNTTANVVLKGVTVNNSSDNVLISVCDDGWSSSSSATNAATLTLNNETITGDMLVGDDSSLTVKLIGSTTYTGVTSGEITNAAGTTVSSTIGTVKMAIGANSTWVLTGDCEVSSLEGTGKIDYNGYTLTVDGTEYSSGSIGTVTEA